MGGLLRRARGPVNPAALAQVVPDRGEVVVLIDQQDDELIRALEQRLRSASFRAVTAADALDILPTISRPAAIIDATTGGDRVGLMRSTVWALPDGAPYVAVSPSRSWAAGVERAIAPRDGEGPGAARRRQELADSVEIDSSDRGFGVIHKRGTHHVTLRHEGVEDVLAERFSEDWGEVITCREAYDYESGATLVMHGEPAPRDKQTTIAVPALSVRRYRDVTCHIREIAVRDNLVLPDSFRHWQTPRLFHKRIVPATAQFGRLEDRMQQADVRREPGEFFSFDSAFPTHYGHLATETLSKFWGWQIARAENPDLRVVMTHQPKKDRLPSWKAQILGALGIPLDDVLWVEQGQAVTVDSLVAAMPQLENPHYVDRGLVDTWQALYAGLGPDPSARDRPDKIFVTRRSRTQRWCTNTPEVEAFMVEQGFTILDPEVLPYAEQAHTFRAARVIAGFAGSGLFNMMVNPAARIVVLSSRSYVAANEYLFASAAGQEIHYFWSAPQVDQPGQGFSVDAYRSDFEFTLDEHRAELIEALA